MGARSLEAKLRTRVAIVVGAAVASIGALSVFVVHRSLRAADDDDARAHARHALTELAVERKEGDAPAVALAEVIAEAEAQGIGLSLDVGGMHASTLEGINDALAGLPVGACTNAEVLRSDGENPWHYLRACAEGNREARAVASIDVTAHETMVPQLALVMSIATLVASAVAALIAQLLVRRATSPLRALVDWSSAIRVDARAQPPPAGDIAEITRLASAFDALVRKLLEAIAREKAAAAYAAHELRTPLTAIIGEVEAMERTDAGEPRRHEAIARVLGDAKRLAAVVDSILFLSRGKASSDATTVVNVADLVRSITSERAGASASNAPIVVEAPDEALVDADASLVELAIRNVVENARRHAGGCSAVSVRRDEDRVRIDVSDRGPGLDDEARGRMFERHWRGEGEARWRGSGLGLALVRAVAERFGGAAWASPREGGGLVVSMTLGPVVGWHDARER